MTGVEILSTSEVVTETAYNSFVVWSTVGVIMLIAIIVGIILSFKVQDAPLFFLCLLSGILISLIAGAVTTSITSTPVAYETRYKVTINDSVLMNEFNDKYEILDQEDRIYTIRERVIE